MHKQEVFDKAAKKWTNKKNLPWARMRYEITNHFLKEELDLPPKKILNIGCGDGIETYLLDSFQAEHLLVDYSEEMIFQATNFLESNN